MPDYSGGKIYALRAPGTDEIYIGSTTQPLSRRLAAHRSDYKMYTQGKKVWLSSFKMIEREGHYIELIEEVDCKTKEQLNKREGECIRNTEKCINRCVAGRTKGEYQKENKDAINEWRKSYRDANRERVNEYARKYRETHAEQIRERAALRRAKNEQNM